MKSSERLFLLRLMLVTDWSPLKDIRPVITAKQRNSLSTDKLIELERRGRANFVRLSDRGWVWCAEHLNEPLGVERNASASILEELLGALSKWIQSENLSLAQFVSPAPAADQNSFEQDSQSNLSIRIEDEIKEASLKIGGGKSKVRIRLSELRNELGQISRAPLDEALLQMSLAGRLHLMSLDNPYEIFEADKQAALFTPSGEVRHILYWVV